MSAGGPLDGDDPRVGGRADDERNDDERNDDERDAAWLLARMRGEPAPAPGAERVASYARLEQALRGLPAPAASEGWQAKVLAAIDGPTGGRAGASDASGKGAGEGGAAGEARGATVHAWPSGGGARGWRVAAPVAAALAAAAALLIFLRAPTGPGGPLLSLQFEQAQTRAVHRGEQAGLGDTLLLEARPDGPGEVRLYRDRRELVLRCPGGEGCALGSEGGRPVVRAKAPLKAPGRYRVMVLSGAGLPAPSGNEDEDLGAAAKAGAKVESASFTVR